MVEKYFSKHMSQLILILFKTFAFFSKYSISLNSSSSPLNAQISIFLRWDDKQTGTSTGRLERNLS